MLSLAVKLDNIERRKRSTGLLHIGAGCYLLAKGVDYLVFFNYRVFEVLLPVFAVVLVSLAYGFMKKSFDPAARYNHWVRLAQVGAFAVLGLLFANTGRQFDVWVLLAWAVICLFLLFTERKVFHDSLMVFNKDGIFIPGYFTNQRIFWGNIQEVVARPDYITIFKKNEKYVQLEVMGTADTAALQAITAYCQQQIRQSIHSPLN